MRNWSVVRSPWSVAQMEVAAKQPAPRLLRSIRAAFRAAASLLFAIVLHCGTPLLSMAAEPAARSAELIVLVGAPGAPDYEPLFRKWAEQWATAAKQAKAICTIIGLDEDAKGDRVRLEEVLKATEKDGPRELWLVLIGHGTFDRRVAKFNLRGPDASTDDLKEWLKPIERPTVVIDTSAASAPFLTQLASSNRVIVSATKSGSEQNFARFGGFLAEALVDPSSDLDKDEQVSLWEAFLAGSRRTAAWYKDEGRLQTEHALLDDNGDGQGTRADAFDGLDPVKVATNQAKLDGSRAHQRHLVPSAAESNLPLEIRRQRDVLELQILELRGKKTTLPEDVYYQQLETLLIELTRLSRTPVSSVKLPVPAGF